MDEPSVPGTVDDDNAWAMNGIAGHAGLFGSAPDVARFGCAVLDAIEGRSRWLTGLPWSALVAPDSIVPGSTRAFGFDTPSKSPEVSSAGSLGQLAPGAIGHLGFTGTSLWVDLHRRYVVALCTNRSLHRRADTTPIRSFRTRFHDAVAFTAESVDS